MRPGWRRARADSRGPGWRSCWPTGHRCRRWCATSCRCAGPIPRADSTPLADTEDDRAPRFGEGIAELGILGRRVEPLRVAPILLDVVHAPLGERARIDLF